VNFPGTAKVLSRPALVFLLKLGWHTAGTCHLAASAL
jgi:hypothetical protein